MIRRPPRPTHTGTLLPHPTLFRSTPPVRRPIRVATRATGDELVPAGTPATGLPLPESNALMLAALLADLPVELIERVIVPDSRDDLGLTFASLSAAADLIVTTGGASVGDHDLVRPALLAAGGSVDYWRIALRPGKPMLAGRLGGAVVQIGRAPSELQSLMRI